MTTSSHKGFAGERHIGTYMGSYVCRNSSCPFVQTLLSHAQNKISLRVPKGRKGIRICAICDNITERESCGAKKFVEYDPLSKEATVYHIGQHTCWLKVNREHRTCELCKKIQEKNLRGPAKQVGINEIIHQIDKGDMDRAAEECETWVD